VLQPPIIPAILDIMALNDYHFITLRRVAIPIPDLVGYGYEKIISQ